MTDWEHRTDRRRFIKLLAGLASAPFAQSVAAPAETGQRAAIRKAIPSTSELVPVIGMGTSRTFDVAANPAMLDQLSKVLEAFYANGGTIIDSSPMYGSAEQVLGELLKIVAPPEALFAATKVWTDGRESGIRQMENSRRLWGVTGFDLMQIHNLRDWRVHYETLRSMKDEGRIRYIGITTSHGRYHDELESILKAHPFDFVQFSYNIANREVEHSLLPLAAERGIAVIVNRPFARGSLFRKTRGRSLPAWAVDLNCSSWGQFFLKFVVSHPAVSCAIPATSKVHHMVDNMGAGFGRLPDSAMRARMADFYQTL